VTPAGPVGRAATADDVAAVTACLASAFHDDPLWGLWTFPDAASRAADLEGFMRFWATVGVRTPWLRVTGACEAAAVWLPPGEPELTGEEEAALGRLLAELLGSRAQEVEALFADFDAHHPEEPHYYLSWWGTHADHRGRGLGAALMADSLARIDAAGMPAYLESTNPVNLPRYEALGFRARDAFGPPGGPVITTMWRAAR